MEDRFEDKEALRTGDAEGSALNAEQGKAVQPEKTEDAAPAEKTEHSAADGGSEAAQGGERQDPPRLSMYDFSRKPGKGGNCGLRFAAGFVSGVFCMAAALVLFGFSSGILSFPARTAPQGGAAGQGGTAEAGGQEAAELDIDKVSDKLALLKAYLDRYYLYDQDAQSEEDWIYKGLIQGIAEDDPYAAYYTAEELEDFTEQTSGAYVGIGVLAIQNPETKESVVVQVYEGSPAAEAGFAPGDVLYQVSGIDVRQMDLDYIVNNLIKGVEGSWVDISVLREGADEPVALHCERRTVETPLVASEMLDGEEGIGYIQLASFSGVGLKQFETAFEQLQSEGMERLVIDLRDNPGGDVRVVTGLLDYLLPDNLTQFTEGREQFEQGKTLLVYMEGKNASERNKNVWYAEDGHAVDLPIVVLVNGNSASASELFAGCLQDYGVATIVGTTTYGKGIAQTTFPLQDGSAIEFTTDMYYLPSGNSVHKKGVVPDVEVELDEAAKQKAVVTREEDNQLARAVEVLKEQ